MEVIRDELVRTAPTPTEIATMTREERDKLLSFSPQGLDTIFPGFSNGEFLRKCYDYDLWLPNPDLQNAMLFAGQKNFERLQQYTYDQMNSFSVQLTNEGSGEIAEYPVESEAAFLALEMVERFMQGEKRRTGEPAVAHIYRSVLRIQEDVIAYYNSLYNLYNGRIFFPPKTAGVIRIATGLHDFEEDKIGDDETGKRFGVTEAVYDTINPDKRNSRFYLRIEREKGRAVPIKEKDTGLKIHPLDMPHLQLTLNALTTNSINPEYIMDHLLSQVKKTLYAAQPPWDMDHFVLSAMPVFIKCGADRPDNNDTYFFIKTKTGEIQPTPIDKLAAKAIENVSLFNDAELLLLRDSQEKTTLQPNNRQESDTQEQSPRSLPWAPTRWSKLVLLGLNPNQMYTISENGGLPVMI